MASPEKSPHELHIAVMPPATKIPVSAMIEPTLLATALLIDVYGLPEPGQSWGIGRDSRAPSGGWTQHLNHEWQAMPGIAPGLTLCNGGKSRPMEHRVADSGVAGRIRMRPAALRRRVSPH
jgi:hypothetical protein